MTQLQLKSLLGDINAEIEKSYNLFGYSVVKKEKIVALLDKIAECIPADIREAELLISRKDEMVLEAQNRAERIIQEAINEQSRLVSENEISRKVQEAATQQKQQVDEYCENVQNTAIKNAEETKILAIREAATIQEGAEDYAEKIFNEMESNISQILNNVHYCQQALAEQRTRRSGQNRQEEVTEE